MDSLFVYGTLIERERMEAVIGRSLPTDPTPAVLHHYAKHDTGAGFPVALEEEGGSIDGAVWYGLMWADFKKLDRYESAGRMYLLESVAVEIDGGTNHTWFYRGNPAFWTRGTLTPLA